jgi:kinesin family protein 3/17
LQDEIKAKNKKMQNLQDDLTQAKGEVDDLQIEFEREREDYLETIRKQERQMELQKLLLEKVQPLLRRDCNYSNLDRIMSESKWDDDGKVWVLPEVAVERTTLPMPGGIAPSPRKSKTGASPPNGYYDSNEEDKFLQLLNRKDSSINAASYFAPKRANRLLESQSLRRQDNSEATHHRRSSSPFHERVSPTEAYPASTMRPVRLESLNPSLVGGGKKSKKKKQLDSL